MLYPSLALAIGVQVLLIGAIGVAAAFIWYIILIGLQLFRFATRRAEASDPADRAGATSDMLARLDGAARGRKALFAQPHENWELKRDGLTLSAVFFPADGQAAKTGFEGGCVILAHGWRDAQFTRSPAALTYLEAGFSVLMPLFRGHGASGGRRIDLGCRYRKDLFAWMEQVKWLADQPPAFFILDGLSMGAANVLTASGDEEMPGEVAAILADCSYSTLIEQGRWSISKMTPLIAGPSFLVTLLLFRVLMGYKRKDPTPLSQVAKASLPILIIHGGDDVFVPTAMAPKLYEACASPMKDFWIVEGAKHAMSEWIAGDLYWERKFAFIKKALEEKGA